MIDTRLIAQRKLPDGRTTYVRPFHISMEGLESALICRDEEDYDGMVKKIFLCAIRCNVIVIIYAVVSNHAHIAVLCEGVTDAKKYAEDLKKSQSMWLRHKYGDEKILKGSNCDIRELDTVRYARNVMAYIPRNAVDARSISITSYKWSGIRAMFCDGKIPANCKTAKSLPTRLQRQILHTKDIPQCNFYLNPNNELEPVCFCDWQYLESLFNHDQAFYFRILGEVDTASINYDILARHHQLKDSDFLRIADDLSMQYFKKSVFQLTPREKIRLITLLRNRVRLSVPQICRCMKMERATIAEVLSYGR